MNRSPSILHVLEAVGANASVFYVRHMAVLARLDRLGPQTMTPLADFLSISTAGITQPIDHLERQGLVVRMRLDDRRKNQVDLTDRGREALAKYRATLEAHIEAFLTINA